MSDRRWRLLLALAGLNVLGYVDRQLVAALAPLLIAELGLSRAQIGLLVGVTFIGVFAIGTLLMGVVADRWSRTRLIGCGLFGWSAATALTGTASGFVPLASWRAIVGIGEATLPPASLALLAERFPPERLGFASSVFYAGIPVGFACSYALAGWLAPRFGWRACFYVLGLLGLVAVAFVWRMGEAPR
ncbi:MAG TPA: MFS transporter, partial [Ideonella sp.]|nr:MFS transporter [Ideonella sp.]